MCLIGSEAANTRGEVAAFLELVFGISSLSLATVLSPSIHPTVLPSSLDHPSMLPSTH